MMDKSLVTFVLFLWGSLAHAVVVDQDWRTPGDANVLYDTEAGMRWLDLSVTANLSHDRVVVNLGPGGRFEGFRLATQSEVLTLWANAGITNTERAWVTYQYPAVNDLVTRLGPTVMVEGGLVPVATHTIGMAEGGPPLPANQRWAMEITYAPDGVSTRTSSSYYIWDVSVADMHYSTYLVQSVPLPGTLWLFAPGV
ncbi:MAG: hypothetical protein HY941_05840, partial [Gammaproteobacteria bacterium]|nr:hypothetical protein [Gammaproteobacteria bacterium]